MPEARKAQVEIVELPLYPEEADTHYISERPVEAVARRLLELGLTREQMASSLRHDIGATNRALDEEEYPSEQSLAEMLEFVGMELVPIRASWRRVESGHWYYGERCVYCKVNTYDADYYQPGLCPSSPLVN